MIVRFASLLSAALLAAALANPGATSAAAPVRATLAPAAGEVIVKFKGDAETVRMHTLAARPDATALRSALQGRAVRLGARNGHVLEAGSVVGERTQVVRAAGIDAATLAAKLAADPEVEYAVPNGRKRRFAAPNDPYYLAGPPIFTPTGGEPSGGPASGQWYLRAPTATLVSSIDIEAAWARSTGTGVVVAVLDTGIRKDHPDLGEDRRLAGYDFVTNPVIANDGGGRDDDASDPGDWVSAEDMSNSAFSGCTVEPSSWHGTQTASLVGAATNNLIGMAGTAPGVKILPVRVLGKCYGDDDDILAGLRWAAGISVPGVPDNPNPARVINLSLGGGATCNKAYQDAINEVRARGAVVVVAAGNDGGAPVGEPANCVGVIGVLALRQTGTKVGFSNLGPEIAIAAPGGNCVNNTGACLYPILAASNTGTRGPALPTWTDSYNYSVGTSFAAPLTAGVAALMLAAQPGLSPDELRSRMQAAARPFPTTGAETGGVGQCRAPSSAVQQLECYCNTTYCGAGMLDAGRAVLVATNPLARIDVTTTAPTAGSPVTLSAASSLPTTGSTVTSYTWSVSNSGGIVPATFASSTATATLTPTAAGSFTITVSVVDGAGNTSLAERTVTVVAAPAPSSGGGGALGWPALLGLSALTLALEISRRAPRRKP